MTKNRTGQESTPPSFAPGLPHVACVLLWYPLFTQPFIFREVQGLRQRLPVSVYSLYGLNLRHCSTEMRNVARETITMGTRALPAILAELLRQMCTRPLQMGRLFWRTMFRRWRSIETLGENLWAFCAGVYLARRFTEAGIDMIYAPWPRGTTTAAWVAGSLAGLPFATCARGDNLEPADPDLGDKLEAAFLVRANNAADKARIENFDKGQARGKVELVYNGLTLPPLVSNSEAAADAPSPGPVRDGSGGYAGLVTHLEEARPSAAPQAMARPVRLLALGRFDVTKGFDVLLRACGLLREQGLDFRLTLAGGGGKAMGLGNMQAELMRLHKELKLEACVTMPGLISHNDLPRLLGEHDIFAAPCVVHASGRRDGIPNTVIEALAYGLPVISTTVNALPELVRHGKTGLAVPPGDAKALAQAIALLAGDTALAAQLARNGRLLAAQMFDPEANTDRLARIFTNNYKCWKESCVE